MHKVTVDVVFKDVRGVLHNEKLEVKCESVSYGLDLLERLVETLETKHSWCAVSTKVKVQNG